MGDTVLLVDYENIQRIDGALLPDDLLVRIFIGGKQSKVRREVLQLVSERRGKVTSVFVDGQASNALDSNASGLRISRRRICDRRPRGMASTRRPRNGSRH